MPHRGFLAIAMKFTAVFASCLLVSIAKTHTIPELHAIPSNVQKLYDTVKNGGCHNYVDNDHALRDGEGHKGEISTALAR
jgi:hypothetical protein